MSWTLAVALATLAATLLLTPSSWFARAASAAPLWRRWRGVVVLAASLPFAGWAVYTQSASREATTVVAAPIAADDRLALEAEAQTARRDRDFPRAVAAFERLAELPGMTADLWADYADALGAARGGLEASESQIRDALSLDPKHPKALWLLGSLQTERRDYGAAMATWQSLLAVLPPESSDARLVSDNLQEAHAALGAGPATAAGPVKPAAGAADLKLNESWLKKP